MMLKIEENTLIIYAYNTLISEYILYIMMNKFRGDQISN